MKSVKLISGQTTISQAHRGSPLSPLPLPSLNIWTCHSFFNRIPTATAVGPLNLYPFGRLQSLFLFLFPPFFDFPSPGKVRFYDELTSLAYCLSIHQCLSLSMRERVIDKAEGERARERKRGERNEWRKRDRQTETECEDEGIERDWVRHVYCPKSDSLSIILIVITSHNYHERERDILD